MAERMPRTALLLVALLAACSLPRAAVAAEGSPFHVVTLDSGDLTAVFRDNAESPRVLSGVDSLFNRLVAKDYDAFDPDGKGASAGLNFEHIISGHANPHNMFTPRHGKYPLFWMPGRKSLQLVRRAEDDPWKVDSTLTYTPVAPCYIDIEFRCIPRDAALFGPRGYAVFFFANYMNDVPNVALHFQGIEPDDQEEHWVMVDAPPGPADYNNGGTYRHRDAPALEYDADHNFKLNLWSYDETRFTQPFYFGRAAHEMTLILMFDRAYTADDEIRFSLFKFKLPKHPRPAWDWQYVIHHVEAGRQYGFRTRLAWKRFISAQDCQYEYQRWSKELAGAGR